MAASTATDPVPSTTGTGEPICVQFVVWDYRADQRGMALLGDAELVVPRPRPDAVDDGEHRRVSWVHCWQSDCMLALLAGSKLTIIGLILRPLTPPDLLICLT